MKTFSQIRTEVDKQNKSLLTEEFQNFGLDESKLIESIDILSKNLILATLLKEQITDSEIDQIVNQIPLDVGGLEDYVIQTKNNIVIINWDGTKATVEVDGEEMDVSGDVVDPEALRGAVKTILQDYPMTEEFSYSEIEDIVKQIPLDKEQLEEPIKFKIDGKTIVVNWDGLVASVEVDGKELVVRDVKDPEALRGAVKGILQDYPMNEELTQDNLSDALLKIPADTKELVGKEIDIDGDKLSIDWNSETGTVKVSVNGKSIQIVDKAYDLETLTQTIVKVVGTDSEEKEEPKEEEPVTDPEIKKKLAVLNTIIKPRLIFKYADTNSDRNRVIAALTDYIKTGSDESKVTADLDQRALVDLLFDLIDVLTTNRNLATLVTKNATASSVSESVILEAKKKSKSKKKTSEETVDVKLDMLLKLGLVDQKIYSRAKKALTNKKAAGTVPYLRNLLFDLLDRLISYIKKDPTLYNRIRINVMKEMKGILPTKKELEEASCAGRKAAESGKMKEVPESYSNHYFTKEAWMQGYDSWDGVETVSNEEASIDVDQIKRNHRATAKFHRNREEDFLNWENDEMAEKHGIAADAHEDAFFSYDPKSKYSDKERQKLSTIANKLSSELKDEFEEDMKTFSEFNESVKLSEINVINDVIIGLEVLSTSPFNTVEEAEAEIKNLLSTIGLTFDKLEDGEIPLVSVEGDNAILSVFSADETAEDELEGDMVLKCNISEVEGGVTVSAEIMVYFEDGEAVALTDVEFEVNNEEDEEEMDDMDDVEEIEEEFETGKVFNVILFKPATRRYLSSIIHADSIEDVEKIVADEMPMYVVHSINPIEVKDTTK
jgi:hypothetical protein